MFVTNEQTPVDSLTKNEVKDIYYKRKRKWSDGSLVRFIDRTLGTEIKKIFLKRYLQRTAEDIDLFWIGQKLYSGDNAPLQQSSETLTLQFVANLKGAISYISSDTPLPTKGVKVLKITNEKL